MKLLVDVDTGVDDALALIYLARAHRAGRVELVGCGTVAGNVDIERATRNTLNVFELAGVQVPVARGAARPLLGPLTTAVEVHGTDGLAETHLSPPAGRPTGEHAADQIRRLSQQYAGELVLLATGPLTNVALALLHDPDVARRLKRLVVMGGGVRDLGNVTPAAEFNFHTDPEAARIVLRSGAPVTLVGLDVTHRTCVREDDLALLEALPTPRARFALRLLRYVMEFQRRLGGQPLFPLHDPLAAGVALEPELVRTRALPVDVEVRGELTRGMLVADLRVDWAPALRGSGPAVDVALEVDAERFVRQFMQELVAWAEEHDDVS